MWPSPLEARGGRTAPSTPGTSQEPFLCRCFGGIPTFEAGQAQSCITSPVFSLIRFLKVQYDHMWGGAMTCVGCQRETSSPRAGPDSCFWGHLAHFCVYTQRRRQYLCCQSNLMPASCVGGWLIVTMASRDVLLSGGILERTRNAP